MTICQRFRFRISTLLLLTAWLATGLAWYVDRKQLTQRLLVKDLEMIIVIYSRVGDPQY